MRAPTKPLGGRQALAGVIGTGCAVVLLCVAVGWLAVHLAEAVARLVP